MPCNADIEGANVLIRAPPDAALARCAGGLIDHARFFTPFWLQRLKCLGLERHNARCKIERLLRLSAARKIAIEIGSRKRNNQGPLRMLAAELADSRITSARVQGNQKVVSFPAISLHQSDPVAQAFKNLCPAQRRNPVSIKRPRRRWSHNPDFHGLSQANESPTIRKGRRIRCHGGVPTAEATEIKNRRRGATCSQVSG